MKQRSRDWFVHLMVNGISNLKTRKISIARGLELCKYRIIFVNVRIIGKSWKTHSESTKTGGGYIPDTGFSYHAADYTVLAEELRTLVFIIPRILTRLPDIKRNLNYPI